MTDKEPKTRGRKPTRKTPEQAAAQGLEMGNERDPNKSTRPPRVPMGAGKNLSIPAKYTADKNYRYYWFIDDPRKVGRIEQAEAAYWEVVTDDSGAPITRPSGAGKMILMKLPMEYALEDKARKQAKNRARMAEESKLGPNEYAPTEDGRPEGNAEMLRKQSTSDNPFA